MAERVGPEKFGNFLKTHGISIRKAADALHVTDPTIIDWRNGTKTPTPEHRGAIRVWTRGEIVDDDWKTDREIEQADNAALVTPFEPAPDSGHRSNAEPTGTEGGGS